MNNRFKLDGFLRRLSLPVVAVVILAGALSARAEDKDKAKDYDPYIMYAFPAGGQRGTTIETMARGRGLEGSTEVRISGTGVTAKVLAIEEPSAKLRQRSANRQDQAENPNVVKISVTIAPDAPLGQRDLRVITPKGATNRFRFIVGQIPEVNEVEPNSLKSEAQTIESLPVTINGQANQADRDIFRFQAKAGETIVCDLHGRKIMPFVADGVPGWLQASLALYDADGKELAYVDDFRFHPDPLLIYKIEKDGQYLIETRDVLFRGREDFVYRLNIGTLPYLTHVFPLGGVRNTDAQIELHGVNLPAKTVAYNIPADSPPLRYVQSSQNGLSSNPLPLAVDDIPEWREAEPNNSVEEANKIEVPVTVNGRIQEQGDFDYYVFHALKDQRLVFDVRARRLGSPIDSIITVYNAAGGRMLENDDITDPVEQLITHHADSMLAYTFRAEADYVIRIRDVQNKGGDEYAYRLVISPPRPDYILRMLPDNPRVPQGGSGVITVNALRKDGFNGQIDLAVDNLPEGLVISSGALSAGQNQIRLTVTAAADAATAVLSPTIRGTATIGDKTLVREAIPAESATQAFIWTFDVPTDEFLLAVIRPDSYALSSDVPTTEVREVAQGTNFQVVVKAARKEEAKAAIGLVADKPPGGITVSRATIAADKNEATLTITVASNAAVGLRQNIIINGTMKVDKETVTCVVPAIPIKVVAAPAKK